MCDENEINAVDINFTSTKNEDVFITKHKTLKQHTSDIVKYYLTLNNDDVIATANALDIGKSTIYKMLQSGDLK
jgi:hypothetical protein